MIFPRLLRNGDKIAIVAPAGKLQKNGLDEAIKELTAWGLKVILGEHVYDTYNYFAGKDIARLTDLQQALELQNMLDVAESVAEASLARKESRGAHQRLDYTERDDENYLMHSQAYRQAGARPRIDWLDVTITRSQPGVRDYSGGKK